MKQKVEKIDAAKAEKIDAVENKEGDNKKDGDAAMKVEPNKVTGAQEIRMKKAALATATNKNKGDRQEENRFDVDELEHGWSQQMCVAAHCRKWPEFRVLRTVSWAPGHGLVLTLAGE